MAERHRKELVGTVLSHKMKQTAVVEVHRLVKHPVFHKVVRRRKKYAAHNEKSGVTVGARVRIRETGPTSRTKRWNIVEVLGSSQ